MKTNGIAFRLAAAMMFAALMAIVLVVVTVYIGAESRARSTPPEGVQAFFRQIATLCNTRPDLFPECPAFVTEGRGPLGVPNPAMNLPNAENAVTNNGNATVPSGGAGDSGGRPRQGGRGAVDIFDPRPWVIPMLVGGTVFAALLALGLALVIGRRIARPIEDVSKAARLVADGQLNTRVKVLPTHHNSEETTQLALSFNRMAQTLEENELERRQFIADIAHELRTPLAVMTSRLEALEDGVFELNSNEVTRLQTQTRLLTRLVDDLRVLSLAETKRLSLDRRPVALDALVAETVHAFESRAEQSSKRISVHTVPAQVNADPDRVRQVLTNLLENALRYAAGTVKVTLWQTGAWVQLEVSDDGDGLPVGVEAQVFDRFYRADQSRNRATGGSGLGLSIVKAITELHGGTVAARNSETGGASFTVTLPVVREAHPKPRLLEATAT